MGGGRGEEEGVAYGLGLIASLGRELCSPLCSPSIQGRGGEERNNTSSSTEKQGGKQTTNGGETVLGQFPQIGRCERCFGLSPLGESYCNRSNRRGTCEKNREGCNSRGENEGGGEAR
eukprot:Sspe_Gene.81548::Locus_52388_Transcript_1_1_Confidence_1.000_Length_501::g.81548::m.81548